MKSIWLMLMAVCLFSLAVASNKPFRLFDGKSFTGWEGNMSVFRIEDGAIVGGSMKAALSRNEFLCTAAEYSDFVLRVRFKLTGDARTANAGVQIRSRRIPNHHEVIGYQADIGQQYWGALYDESRRKKVLMGPTPEDARQIAKPGEWNEYVIRAEGRRIKLELNGRETVNYTEPDETIEQKGCICFQVHGGPASEVRYKDIIIELLPQK